MLISLALCSATLFADVRAHTGGARWDAVAEIVGEGTAFGEGLGGHTRIATDVKSGATSTLDKNAFAQERIVSAPDATWKEDLTSGVHPLDAPDARAAARTSAYLARNGFFHPDTDPAGFACLPNVTEDARVLRQVRITPRGGRPVTVWIDPAEHVIVRTQEQAPSNLETTNYGAYRETGGLVLPHEIIVTDGRPEDTILRSIRTYRVASASNAADFARPPDSRNQRFLNGSSSTQVTADFTGGSPVIEAYVDGHGPLAFILDTGGHAILTAEAAKTLGLTPKGAGASGGAGEGTIAVQFTNVHSVRIGDAEITDLPMLVIPYPPGFSNRGPGKTPLAGILGLEVFERFAVTVDYANQAVRLQRPGSYTPARDEVAVPIVFQDDMPLAYGSADGSRGLFGIDTGNGARTFLFGDFLRDHGFFARYDQSTASQSMGTGGAVHSSTVRLDELDFGGLAMRNFVSEFVVQQQGSFGSRTEAGNIGHDVLAQFTLTTDYARGRLYLRHNPSAPLPAYTRTGFVIGGYDAARHLIVGSVVPNSPASEAGLHQGDVVVAIEGKPVEGYTPSELFAFTRLPTGAQLRFSVSTGRAAPRDVTLTLRELLCKPNTASCSPSVEAEPSAR